MHKELMKLARENSADPQLSEQPLGFMGLNATSGQLFVLWILADAWSEGQGDAKVLAKHLETLKAQNTPVKLAARHGFRLE